MESGFTVYYDFEYKGFEDKFWDYEVPMAILVAGIREYFSRYNVELDGTDSAIWNSLHDVDGALDEIFETMTEWYEDKCEKLAFEKFKEYAESELEWKAEREGFDEDLDEEEGPERVIKASVFADYAKRLKDNHPEMGPAELWALAQEKNDIYEPVFSREEIEEHKRAVFDAFAEGE